MMGDENRQAINPYEASSVSSGVGRRSPFRSSAGFVLALVESGGLFVGILLTQGQLEAVFSELELPLPQATLIALSRWTLVLVGGLFVLTLTKEFVDPRRTRVRVCNVIACLATLFLGGLYVLAMIIPFIPIGTTAFTNPTTVV